MFSHEEFFNFVSTTSPIFLPSILYSIQLVLLAVLVYLNLRNSTILNFLQLKTPPKENRSPTEAPKFEDIPETQAEISQLEANSTKPNSETTQFKSCIPLIQFIFGTTTNHQDMADLLNDDVTRNIVSDYLVKLSFEGLISFRSVHGRKEIIIGNDGMRCGGLSNQPAEKTTAIQYARSIELVPALAERRHDLELQCADLPCLIGVGGYIRKSSPKTQDRSNFPMEVLNVHLHGTTETKLKTFRFHAYRWQCSPKIETQKSTMKYLTQGHLLQNGALHFLQLLRGNLHPLDSSVTKLVLKTKTANQHSSETSLSIMIICQTCNHNLGLQLHEAPVAHLLFNRMKTLINDNTEHFNVETIIKATTTLTTTILKEITTPVTRLHLVASGPLEVSVQEDLDKILVASDRTPRETSDRTLLVNSGIERAVLVPTITDTILYSTPYSYIIIIAVYI
jgi:hypothetical protein